MSCDVCKLDVKECKCDEGLQELLRVHKDLSAVLTDAEVKELLDQLDSSTVSAMRAKSSVPSVEPASDVKGFAVPDDAEPTTAPVSEDDALAAILFCIHVANEYRAEHRKTFAERQTGGARNGESMDKSVYTYDHSQWKEGDMPIEFMRI